MIFTVSEIGCVGETPEMQMGHFRRVLLPFLCLSAQFVVPAQAAGELTFRSDEWITECSIGTSDCSITVPFWQTQGDRGGSGRGTGGGFDRGERGRGFDRGDRPREGYGRDPRAGDASPERITSPSPVRLRRCCASTKTRLLSAEKRLIAFFLVLKPSRPLSNSKSGRSF